MIKNRNYSLDLLRVIACYLVIQQHASEFYYIGIIRKSKFPKNPKRSV